MAARNDRAEAVPLRNLFLKHALNSLRVLFALCGERFFHKVPGRTRGLENQMAVVRLRSRFPAGGVPAAGARTNRGNSNRILDWDFNELRPPRGKGSAQDH